MTTHTTENIIMDLEQVPEQGGATGTGTGEGAGGAGGAQGTGEPGGAAGGTGEQGTGSAGVAPVSLTLNCLSNVKNLVDVAISRGAYKPNEVSTVGKIYDEFVAGLKTVIDATTPNSV